MDRSPDKPQSVERTHVRPAFERAADPELVRQGDITLKTERITVTATRMHALYERFAHERHEGTTYTQEDIDRLKSPFLRPPGIPEPVRILGTIKTPDDVRSLANIDARERIKAKTEALQRIAKDMKENGLSVSNGQITQTRRGGDARPKKFK